MNNSNHIKDIIKKEKYGIIFELLILVTATIFKIIAFYQISIFVENIMYLKLFDNLNNKLGLIFVLWLISILLEWYAHYNVVDYASKIVSSIRENTFSKLHKFKLTFFNNISINTLINFLITKLDKVFEIISYSFFEFSMFILEIVVSLIALFMLNKSFAIAILIFLVVEFIILTGILLLSINKTSSYEVDKKYITETSINNISNIKLSVASNKCKNNILAFHNYNKKYKSKSYSLQSINNIKNSIVTVSIIILAVISIYYCGFNNANVNFSVLVFAIFIISEIFIKLYNFNYLIKDVFDFDKICTDAEALLGYEHYEDVSTGSKVIESLNGNIVYNDVKIKRLSVGDYFNKLSFNILPKDKVYVYSRDIIDGANIVNPIIGSEYIGSIKINGVEVKDIAKESLKNNILYLEKEPFTFSGTIMENILYGKKDATEEEIIALCRLTEIHDYINNLKNGYDTEINSISKEYKYLISITRAILKNPNIVIIEDRNITANLLEENLIQKALSSLARNRTTFVISNKKAMLKGFNCYITVEDDNILFHRI